MFKQEFKYYKSKIPPPDLSRVLNFNCRNSIKEYVRPVPCNNSEPSVLGLRAVTDWEAFEILHNPGLVFIRNPFTTWGQRYWITRCLRDYTKRPNKLNLDSHNLVPANQDWWDWCEHGENKIAACKLRWATLGYHHNWDTKVYSEDSKNIFPSDLALLTKYVATTLGYRDFTAEAAIVNYYHLDSTLSGHTDHSEQNLEAPLFSFSFGQSAIFLVGGTSQDVLPTAMFLHSGDIVVMSKESRLCYHGIPKILKAPECTWNKNDANGDYAFKEYTELVDDCKKRNFWNAFNVYLSDSRININVRQVKL